MTTSTGEQLISLQSAQELCPYSQDYLSLRARQGKLKAVKIGRNWSTTKEWLEEYVVQVDRYKESLLEKRNTETPEVRWVDPPSNLPVYAPDADALEYATASEIAERAAFWRKFQFVAATISLIMFLGASVAQEKNAVVRVADEVSPVVISTSIGALSAAERMGVDVGEKVLVAGIGEIAQEYIVWLSRPFRGIAGWFSPEERVADSEEDAASEKLVEQSMRQSAPKSEKRGLVVIPSTGEDEKMKEEVRQSFSDEVMVTPRDEESGIITPVFRERTGEDYLYILVPLSISN